MKEHTASRAWIPPHPEEQALSQRRRADRSQRRSVEPSTPGKDTGIEGIVEREIEFLLAEFGIAPKIVAVADRVSIPVRTLQRRLGACDVTFSILVERVRQRLAIAEIARGQASIGEVAGRLGYTDPAHFARAFRRWTGTTPSSFGESAESGRDFLTDKKR